MFACKLIEKAYRSGCFCYVLTDSAEQSRIIDDLLWTFRAGSFIPHQIYAGEPPDIEKIVLIGSMNVPEHWQKTLFNLSAQYPVPEPQTGRILEILDNSETTKEAGRKRLVLPLMQTDTSPDPSAQAVSRHDAKGLYFCSYTEVDVDLDGRSPVREIWHLRE